MDQSRVLAHREGWLVVEVVQVVMKRGKKSNKTRFVVARPLFFNSTGQKPLSNIIRTVVHLFAYPFFFMFLFVIVLQRSFVRLIYDFVVFIQVLRLTAYILMSTR